MPIIKTFAKKIKFHFGATTANNAFFRVKSFGDDGGFLTSNNSDLAQSQIYRPKLSHQPLRPCLVPL
jgi:hypothetical protein